MSEIVRLELRRQFQKELETKNKELEKFIGTDFKSITDNWDKTFSEPYVYNKKGRETFF